MEAHELSASYDVNVVVIIQDSKANGEEAFWPCQEEVEEKFLWFFMLIKPDREQENDNSRKVPCSKCEK